MSAFHNDAAVKDRLLGSDEGNAHPLLSPGINPADLLAWADAMGLPAAFVLLARQVARGNMQTRGSGETAEAFVPALLREIEPGADLTPIAHRWVQWAWEEAPEALRSAMNEPELVAAGQEAVALHGLAADGEQVDRSAWRAARSKLNRLAEGDSDGAAAAAVLAASSWDYESVPGAASDMASAWEKMVMARIRREEGWGEAEDARVQQIILEQRERAEEKFGAPAGSQSEADKAHRKQIVDEMLAGMNKLEEPLLHRNAAMQARIHEAFGVLRESGRNALIKLTRAPATIEG